MSDMNFGFISDEEFEKVLKSGEVPQTEKAKKAAKKQPKQRKSESIGDKAFDWRTADDSLFEDDNQAERLRYEAQMHKATRLPQNPNTADEKSKIDMNQFDLHRSALKMN